jgi:hypothetical protein
MSTDEFEVRALRRTIALLAIKKSIDSYPQHADRFNQILAEYGVEDLDDFNHTSVEDMEAIGRDFGQVVRPAVVRAPVARPAPLQPRARKPQASKPQAREGLLTVLRNVFAGSNLDRIALVRRLMVSYHFQSLADLQRAPAQQVDAFANELFTELQRTGGLTASLGVVDVGLDAPLEAQAEWSKGSSGSKSSASAASAESWVGDEFDPAQYPEAVAVDPLTIERNTRYGGVRRQRKSRNAPVVRMGSLKYEKSGMARRAMVDAASIAEAMKRHDKTYRGNDSLADTDSM